MKTALIVGSGPAAAGVALALSRSRDLEITVVDIGIQLEQDRQDVVERLASSEPLNWDESTLERISEQPVDSGARGVPEKRSYGSDFPFRNVGQLDGLTATEDATRSLISAAYGGFSNVWGSQLMPFTDPTFESWPITAAEMRVHYEAILDQIPFAGEVDDLADNFPLMRRSVALPQLSPRSQRVLDAYARHRKGLNRRGITIGKARLAFDAPHCVRCRMCMTGCPYGLIYSATQTFDDLRRTGRVTHRSGFLVLKVDEQGDRGVVIAKELSTGGIRQFEADRVFIAGGAMGSTRIAANSLGLFDVDLTMGESQQFILPMLSVRPTPDPRREPDFTLNQFNMVLALDEAAVDISQLHLYTFNSAFIKAMPPVLRGRTAEALQVHLLRRLTVVLGYLPSWRSPRLRVRFRPPVNQSTLPDLHLSRDSAPSGRNQGLRTVIARLSQSAPVLDLYPVVPMLRLAVGGKSYHLGGSFPHSNGRATAFSSDRLGRVGPWKRTHLVDASVFPNVPAMTFTLTIMANAHRIATEAAEIAS